MLRAPGFLLSLSASLVLFALDHGEAFGADLVFDGSVIDNSRDNTPGVSIAGKNLDVLIANSKVTTQGELSHGVNFAGSDNTGELRSSEINTRGANSFGLNLQGGAQVQADTLTLDTTGQFSSAINVLENSSITLKNSELNTAGASAHGLYLLGTNTAARSQASVNDTIIRTSGDNAIGVNVNRNATATLTDTQIFTSGANANGVWVPDADSQLIANNLSIDTQGDGAIGVFTQRGGYASLDGGQVHTSGQLAYALYAGNSSAIDAKNLSLQVGAGSVGAFAAGASQINLDHVDLRSTETTLGLAAYSGSTITANNSTVELNGDAARALQANNGGALLLNSTAVSANGQDGMGLQSLATAGVSNSFSLQNSSISAADGRAISVQGGNANIDLSDTTIIGKTLLAVEKRQMSNGALEDSQDVLINAVRSHLTGSVQSDALNADLQLHDHSTLSGDIQGLNYLTLDQSTWQMTNASHFGSLNLNDGQVSFAGAPFSTLALDGDLTGSGTFAMRTDLAAQQGDLLKVGGQIEGNHTLVVADSGHDPVTANGQLMLVDGNGGAGTFGLYGGHVDAGAFRYTLEQQGNDWFLVNTSAVPGASNQPAPEHLSAGANAAIASQTAAASLWASQMDTLVKRFGELRMGKDDGGVWTRAIGGRYNVAAHSSRGFSQNNSGVEIGADKAVPMANGKVYVGGMFGTAQSSLNFGEGASGQIDSRMVGAYGTYLDDSGVYVNGVLKYARFDNDLKLPTNLGGKVKGSYATHGYGMDLEAGKHIALDHDWFVEPQVELSASRTQAARYTATNGLRVEAGAMNSLQSRVGSLFGRSLELGNGMKAQPYVKASFVSELAGTSHVKVNGNRLKSELPGNRVELGFGATVQVSERSKLSFDTEFSKGQHIEQPWGLTVGYRYLW